MSRHTRERPPIRPSHAPTHELAEIIAPVPTTEFCFHTHSCKPETVQFPGNRLGWGRSREPRSHIPRDRHAIRDARTNTRTCPSEAIALPKGLHLRQERGLMIFVALLEQQREEGASGILTSNFFVHKK